MLAKADTTEHKLIVFTEHRDTLNYLEGRFAVSLNDQTRS